MNNLFYKKYLKYKKKYVQLKALCNNMEKYAKTMSETINVGNKSINLKFNYLDNWNECYQEAANFITNKDYNLNYLNDCIQNISNGTLEKILKYDNSLLSYTTNKKLELNQIIIVSIGSSSTQAYYFRYHRNNYIPIVINLKNGKWYGVQNYDEKEENINDIYNSLVHIANKENIKHIILHKSGSFGFKHIKEPRIIIPIDYNLPESIKFNIKELEDKKNKDAYITLNQLMKVIITNKNKNKSIINWFSVGNFDCFKADWIENAGLLYFNKTSSKDPLYIMDFGGGSNSLKQIINNNGLIIKNLFSGRYDQPHAISLINSDDEENNVLANYKNDGQDKTIKEQIIDRISKEMTQNTANVYIFQTGLQREFGNDYCSNHIKLRDFFTKENDDIWNKII
jgi:hypothetical protein